MSKNKFTTRPSDVDKDSHVFSSSSDTCGESSKSGDQRSGIIKRVISYILKQKWWVVIIFTIIGVGIHLLIKYL